MADVVKWTGIPEASPVRQAHPLAPADWMLCVQARARDLSPLYAMFFTGDSMVHFASRLKSTNAGARPMRRCRPMSSRCRADAAAPLRARRHRAEPCSV